jgi:hypothetical protein
MDVKNIYNNSMPIPQEWEGRQNITVENSWDLLNQLGFRKCPEVVPVAEGYVRIGDPVLVEDDGDFGKWEYNDITQAEYDAQQVQRELDRQAAKPAALKVVERRFLDLCETLSGQRAKLGFAYISATIEAMMSTDPTMATALSLRLLAIDAEGKREGGLAWWDDCADHPEVEQ